MNTAKIENLLDLSMEATEEEREKSSALNTGYSELTRSWEIIVKYAGDLEPLREKYKDAVFTELLNGYAIIEVSEADLGELSLEQQIEYI